MIYYLTTRKHLYTMREFLAGMGAPLADRVRIMAYGDFLEARRHPLGTYIFADIDRVSGSQSEIVFRIWRRLKDAGARLLNDPIRSMRRYDLLRWLHENGINDFDAYLMVEHRKPKRFPVFIRRAFDHEGAMSPLIANQADLDAALAAIRADGGWPADKLITEYIDVSDADGVFRKYAAFCVGDHLIPRQIMAAKQWIVKKPEFDSPALAAEEAAYLRDNPHRDLLVRVFEAARIDYGRIDYGVVNGKVQIFEINTNPSIIGERSTAQIMDPNSLRGPALRTAIDRYIEAMAALDTIHGQGEIEVQP